MHPGPVGLACDTSPEQQAIALWEKDRITVEWSLGTRGGTSRGLAGDIAMVLARRGLDPRDLDFLVTSLGPGSFTGVRVVMSTLKGMAMALGKPLFGVDVLGTLAGPHRGRAGLAALDARRGEVYGAAWAPDGSPLVPPGALRAEALASRVAKRLPAGARVLAVGDGVLAWREALEREMGDRLDVGAPRDHLVRASAMIEQVLDGTRAPLDPASVEPIYLRRPDAEVPRT